jgi:4-hydroxybenzoate polyprenyltransferase
LGYDTIYGTQDMSDDEIIGLKSTSIKFKKNIKIFVSFCYLLSFLILMMLFFKNLELNYFTFFLGTYFISLIYQIKMFNKNNPVSCLNAFKINNISGLLLFLTIYLI